MMKKITVKAKILCIAMVICTIFTMFGCAPKVKDDENTLIVNAYLGGYGTSFLDKLADKFEAENPGKTVIVTPNIALTHQGFEAELKLGAKYNPGDLYFTSDVMFNQIVSKGPNFLKGYDCALEDLSDLYDSAPTGESVKIIDKMSDEFSNYYLNENGNRYAIPWAGGTNGIVYHADVFNEKGWVVPKTTNELIALQDEIKADGWVPFTWNKFGYWDYADYTWWAQYQGLNGYQDFFRAKDVQGNYTYELFAQTGRLESMKVLDSLIGVESNSFTGSLVSSHTDSQMRFLDKESNKIAMIPNGDWLENEMKSNYPVGSINMRMMKTPVISSILKTLPDKSITTDAQLSQAIAVIDGEKDAIKPAGITQQDFDRITEARQMAYSLGFSHNAMIPVYSNAKQLAKDFLKMLYSDEGIQIYLDETGSMLPFESAVFSKEENLSKMTYFQESKKQLADNAKYISRMYYFDPLFYKAGLKAFNETLNPELKIGAIGEDKISASKFIENEYNYVKNRFDQYKIDAGIRG